MNHRHRVLAVDDEPGVRRIVERVLRVHHYDVVSVPDPDSAYQMLGEHSFDLILLDLRLPGISGDAFFLAIIRQWPRLRGRVILMSGDPLPPQGDWPIELAGCPVLHKPFGLDTLVTTVSRVLADLEPDSDIREGNGNP